MSPKPDDLARRLRTFARRALWLGCVETVAWGLTFLIFLSLAVVAIDGVVRADERTLVVLRLVVPVLAVSGVVGLVVRSARSVGGLGVRVWAEAHGLDTEWAASVWSIGPERGVREALRTRARQLLVDSAGTVERWPASRRVWSAVACATVVLFTMATAWGPIAITAARLWSPRLAPPAWSEPQVRVEVDEATTPVGSSVTVLARTEHDVGNAAPRLLVDGTRVHLRPTITDAAASWTLEMPARHAVVSVEWGEARSRRVALHPLPDPVLESWTLRVDGGGAAVFDGATRAVVVEAAGGASVSLHARMAAKPSELWASQGDAQVHTTGFAWSGFAAADETVTLTPFGPTVPGGAMPRRMVPPITLSFVRTGNADPLAADGPLVDAVLASPDGGRSPVPGDARPAGSQAKSEAESETETSERAESERAGPPSEQAGTGAGMLQRSTAAPVESIDADRQGPSSAGSVAVVDSVSGGVGRGATEATGWRADLIRAYIRELRRAGLSGAEREEETR